MVVIARKGRVSAPVDEVWAVVSSVDALPAWLAGLRRARAEGPEGFGRRLWLTGCTGDGLDRRADIIAWKAPTLMAWRCVGERSGGRAGHGEPWEATRADELHVQLTPLETGTQVRLYAVCPATAWEGLRLRVCLGPARRWRRELARSVTALGELFLARSSSRP